LIGYHPTNDQRDGKYRRVRVQLVGQSGDSALRVDYRKGYYPPAQ
jgi:hypothetical protein